MHGGPDVTPRTAGAGRAKPGRVNRLAFLVPRGETGLGMCPGFGSGALVNSRPLPGQFGDGRRVRALAAESAIRALPTEARRELV